MGKFIKAGRVVVMLQGRYAGKKAIVVKTYDDGSKARPFGHCMVAGIDRAPLKVTRKMSKKKITKRTKVKPFVKYVNYNPHDAHEVPGAQWDVPRQHLHGSTDGDLGRPQGGQEVCQEPFPGEVPESSPRQVRPSFQGCPLHAQEVALLSAHEITAPVELCVAEKRHHQWVPCREVSENRCTPNHPSHSTSFDHGTRSPMRQSSMFQGGALVISANIIKESGCAEFGSFWAMGFFTGLGLVWFSWGRFWGWCQVWGVVDWNHLDLSRRSPPPVAILM